MLYRTNEEISEDAALRFNFLFDKKKAEGLSDLDAAIELKCEVHREELRFNKKREAREISFEDFTDADRVLHTMAIWACDIIDIERGMVLSHA